ncbi:MAG: hypothetical protein J6L76_04560 [Clostridia bacterium]|nr:hypothetical protein [Clostridia bacterium]
MKNIHNVRVLVFILLVTMFFCGVACKKSNQHKNPSEIVIYKISRETFFLFLENPTIPTLNSEGNNKRIYSQSGQWYITSDVKRFEIEQSLLDFVGDKSKIQKFLSQYGVNDEVRNAFVLDAPNVPLTIWVETSKDNLFITIEKQNADHSYVYEYYTLSDYNNKYYWDYAALMVNNKEIKSTIPAKIYSGYAEVPFMLVLKSLDATVTSLTNEQFEIFFKGENYVLDVDDRSIYAIGKEEDNLLHKDGGVAFIYPYESDIMIDTFTLNTVLRQMGEKIVITCDKTNKIVALQTE